MNVQHYIACDLGAESVRVILGSLEDGKLAIEEVHRFENRPIRISGSLRWDVSRLFNELKTGLQAIARRGISPASVSCDSWGVDYVLMRSDASKFTPPYHYRDSRTDGALESAFARVPAAEIFEETGIQFMPINTLYQILADLRLQPDELHKAERFLNIGDYFNFLFSGVAKAEESLASTTQLYNPRKRAWSQALIREFGIPEHLFPEIVPSGTILGPLLSSIGEETGLRGIKVVAGCSHDTGAAVAAVPAQGEQWAYLSSGTWSLLGIESPHPIINKKSREYSFTNEVGYGGKIRFLKNIVGLWVVQECRRHWANEGAVYGYEQLMEMAGTARPLVSLIDPADERFSKPDNMPEKIASYCRESGQPVPGAPGAFVRCILESLAHAYRRSLEQLEDVTGMSVAKLHVVGGGSKNRLLNQLTANAIGRTVLAGPVECSAIGNVLIQAIALGHVSSLEAARDIVRSSFSVERFEPSRTGDWENAAKHIQLPVHR